MLTRYARMRMICSINAEHMRQWSISTDRIAAASTEHLAILLIGCNEHKSQFYCIENVTFSQHEQRELFIQCTICFRSFSSIVRATYFLAAIEPNNIYIVAWYFLTAANKSNNADFPAVSAMIDKLRPFNVPSITCPQFHAPHSHTYNNILYTSETRKQFMETVSRVRDTDNVQNIQQICRTACRTMSRAMQLIYGVAVTNTL